MQQFEAKSNEPTTIREYLNVNSPFQNIRTTESKSTVTNVNDLTWEGLPNDWRAYRAVPDNDMIHNLCIALDGRFNHLPEAELGPFRERFTSNKNNVDIDHLVRNEAASEQTLS